MDRDPIEEIMEDILRIAVEKKKEVIFIPMLKEDITVNEELLTKAIYELEKDGLVYISNNKAILTEKGREKASKILARHEIIEKYFHEILEEPMPHHAAHALEHFISSETIRNMRKFLTVKEKGKSLLDFSPKKKILIIATEISDKTIFERIIGLGLTPGSRLMVEEENPDAIILNMEGRKIALAKEIAKDILAIEEDEGS